MERHNATRLLIVAIGIAGILTAQTRIDLSSQSRRIDFSNAPAVKPLPVGSVLPATCNVGEMFFKTDAANGQNVYMCPAHDVWVQSAIPMSLQTGSSGGILLTGSAETLDVDADTMFLATQAGNNLFIGHNDFSGAASLRITTGSLEPAAAGCDSSSETGSIYMLTGDSTKANLLYICQANAGGFGWHAGTYAQGANAPSTCVVGQVFFDTDAPAGENWLGCTTANTWTVIGKPHGKGPTAPASCSVGDVFFDTDAAAGENWLGCTTTNTWTAIGKPHGKGPTPPASCSVGDVFFDTDAAAGENWLGCTATNSWTVIGNPTERVSHPLSPARSAMCSSIPMPRPVRTGSAAPQQTPGR